MASQEGTKSATALEEFLGASPLQLFIGGQWCPSRLGETFEVLDPGLGARLADVHDAGEIDVDAAVRAARQAFQKSGWARMAPNERGVYLHRLADLVESHKNTLARIESLDVGKPLDQAVWDIENFSATMRYYTELSQHVAHRDPIAVARHEAWTVRHPYGVCGFIFPWNFPFLLVGWGISPALAAGNTVVIKPAEDTPLSTLYLARLAKEAGIPDGVINVIPGLGETAGAALARHSGLNRMSFTGSPEVGRLVAEACGRNLVAVKLELGGKGAAVIFEDVDLDSTVDQLVRAITLNAGQVCCTASRWVVHDSIYSKFAQRAVDRMKEVRIGYWNDTKTEMGPLVSSKQVARVLGYLERGCQEGAEALLQGGRTKVPGKEGGFYVKPAILAGSAENVAAREEIFGPVPFLLRFRDESEAIDIVNRSPYGLANSVWTEDLNRAHRVAEKLAAGNSWINAHNVFVHGVPYAGINLSGLGGGVLGPRTYFDYLREKSVVRPL
ncbi:MAG: aldehyde dehydrogenase family protein [Acidobacteria bacterium]|nr:aldehyde dehydrogenase family protein [Acidobacteriota bacterium]